MLLFVEKRGVIINCDGRFRMDLDIILYFKDRSALEDTVLEKEIYY